MSHLLYKVSGPLKCHALFTEMNNSKSDAQIDVVSEEMGQIH